MNFVTPPKASKSPLNQRKIGVRWRAFKDWSSEKPAENNSGKREIETFHFMSSTQTQRPTELTNPRAPGPSVARAQGFLVAQSVKTIVNVAIAA